MKSLSTNATSNETIDFADVETRQETFIKWVSATRLFHLVSVDKKPETFALGTEEEVQSYIQALRRTAGLTMKTAVTLYQALVYNARQAAFDSVSLSNAAFFNKIFSKAALPPVIPRLTYFNHPGRGEFIRVIFAAADIPFEDRRIQWPQFCELRDSGALPFGQLPVLRMGDVCLAETSVLINFASRMAFGEQDALTTARCEQVVAIAYELASIILKLDYATPAKDQKALEHNIRTITIPTRLDQLERLLEIEYPAVVWQTSDGESPTFFVNGTLSQADCAFLVCHQAIKTKQTNPLANYPRLARVVATCERLPNLQRYYANQPHVTKF